MSNQTRPITAQLTPNGAALHNLPRETPVAMVLDGSSSGVLMSSPMDLQDLATGFAISEGFINGLDDIREFEETVHPSGIEARLWLTRTPATALAKRRRMIAGPVGCGMCGIDSLDQAMRRIPQVSFSDMILSAQHIMAAPDQLRARQPLHDETRAAHAAGFLDQQGNITMVREDVGRHNALDKLIGGLTRNAIDPASGAIVMTSRLSLELIQKSAMVGCGIIIAVSSPTAEAVEAANRAQITTVGFARQDNYACFTHPQRIAP